MSTRSPDPASDLSRQRGGAGGSGAAGAQLGSPSGGSAPAAPARPLICGLGRVPSRCARAVRGGSSWGKARFGAVPGQTSGPGSRVSLVFQHPAGMSRGSGARSSDGRLRRPSGCSKGVGIVTLGNATKSLHNVFRLVNPLRPIEVRGHLVKERPSLVLGRNPKPRAILAETSTE